MNKPWPLCIYHDHCNDGYTAAWAVWHRIYMLDSKPIELFPASYNKPAPDLATVANRDVIIVDFSYPRAVIDSMALTARSILILDHHKTAQADLSGYPDPEGCWGARGPGKNVFAIFDMNRSGAGIAWDFFHPGKPRPLLVNYVEDRDLWRFWMGENTKKVHAGLASFPFSLDSWDALAEDRHDNMLLLIGQGDAILRSNLKIINDIIATDKRYAVIEGYNVPVANMPGAFASDAGSIMAKGEMFSATYHDTASDRHFSLRSDEHGIDVSAIAKRFGGGGHFHAAGFSVPRSHPYASI